MTGDRARLCRGAGSDMANGARGWHLLMRPNMCRWCDDWLSWTAVASATHNHLLSRSDGRSHRAAKPARRARGPLTASRREGYPTAQLAVLELCMQIW